MNVLKWAFVLESSEHMTVPELPNPLSEMVTSTPTLSGGYFTPMEDGNLSPIPVCDVLSHYKESCLQPALASIPTPTSLPACPSQVSQTRSCLQRDFPESKFTNAIENCNHKR